MLTKGPCSTPSTSCASAATVYVGAAPYVKRLPNAQVLKRVEIKVGELVSVELKPPFHGLFLLAGSNKGSLVGLSGRY